MSSSQYGVYAPPGALVRHKHSKQLTKTVMCRFFLQGTCGKGSRCAYAHSADEIRDKPDLTFTSMCRTFLQIGSCPDPHCTFAHSEAQLRTTAGFFKTKRCRFAASGRCRHGSACRFAHSAAELQMAQKCELGEEAGEENPAFPAFEEGVRNEAATEASSNSGSNQTGPESPGPARRHTQARGQAVNTGGGQGSTGGTSSSGDQALRSSTTPSQQNSRSGGSSDWAEASSDQSTRADTAASVPTPEGSGDSGQEEFACRAQAPMPKRRSNETVPARRCTTVMLTNIPTFLTQGALVSLLEDLTTNARGAFDFFYCPWDPYEDRNLGYAIVNFFTRAVAAEFERQWANKPLLRERGVRKMRIVPAALQGRAANLRHFSDFNLANHPDPRFRPLIRAGPNEPLRPMALCQELPASSNRSAAAASTNGNTSGSNNGSSNTSSSHSQARSQPQQPQDRMAHPQSQNQRQQQQVPQQSQQQQFQHPVQPQQQQSPQPQQQQQQQQQHQQQQFMLQQQVQHAMNAGAGMMVNQTSTGSQQPSATNPASMMSGRSRQPMASAATVPAEAAVPTPAMAGVGGWGGCNLPFIVVQPNGLGGWDPAGPGWNAGMFANGSNVGNPAMQLQGAPMGQSGLPEEVMTQLCWAMPMQQQAQQPSQPSADNQQQLWNNGDNQGDRSPDSSDDQMFGLIQSQLRSQSSGGGQFFARPGSNISYIGV